MKKEAIEFRCTLRSRASSARGPSLAARNVCEAAINVPGMLQCIYSLICARLVA